MSAANGVTLRVNEYGRRKAVRFRLHFGLTADDFADKTWIDVHDYLHTVLGAFPVDMEDEMRVLQLYESVAKNGTKLRGLLQGE